MNTVAKIRTEDATPVSADTFAQAFVKLQHAIKPAIKDATNPAFRSKYAGLGAVWDAVREPLALHGFGVIQAPQFEGETMWLETTLLHASGEKMTSRYPLRPVKQDPQGFGSAITYAKRYALSAILGVVADDDDDGNAASGVNGNGHGHGPAPAPQGNITPAQVERILSLVKETKTDIEKFCAYFKAESVPAIRAADFDRAITALEGKRK